MKVVIGIDPGVSGGIAVISEDRKVSMMVTHGKSNADLVAGYRAAIEVARNSAEYPRIIAVVERVASFPGQGASSTFTFGERYGLLQGVLLSLGIPFVTVPSQTWQKELGLSQAKTPKDPAETAEAAKKRKAARRKNQKTLGLQLAKQLYPKLELDTENADGVLLAEYGLRRL